MTDSKALKHTQFAAAFTIFIRILLALAGLLAIISGLMPFFVWRVTNPSSLALIFSGVLCMAISLCFARCRRLIARIRQRLIGRIVWTAAVSLFTAGVLIFLIFSVLMGAASSSSLEVVQGIQTVVVLGAKVNGNGEPTVMLQNRLDAAIRVLSANPEAVCIVTGGQGEDEPITEARAMRNYLINKGVNSDRIYMEEESANTYENLQNAKKIVDEFGMSTEVVLITDEFHQFRGQFFAKKAGFNPVPYASRTPWFALPMYWVREVAGVGKALLFGQ